ncbi:MAG: Hsp20/alpha crystallin family protein [Desulfobacteraceae bacterium]
MALVKYNPFNEIVSFNNRLGNLFNDPFFKPFFDNSEGEFKSWQPVVDIYEENNHIVVKADLPGVKKEDISIDVENRVLTVKGEKVKEDEVKEESFLRRERSYGSFQRSFTLPSDITTDDIKADFKEGILKVEIPKPVKEQAKQIAIN